jgi:hypothetical protein
MIELFTTSPQLVLSGVTPSLMESQIPLWKNGSGILFSDASVQNYPGSTQLFALSAPPLDLIQAYVDTDKRIYVGTFQQLLRYTDGVGVTQLSLSVFGAWYLTSWGSWLIASDDQNPVQVSKDGVSLSNLAGTPFTRARIVEKYQNYLIAMNTSNGGTMVEWSNLDNPEEWNYADPTETSGQYPIRDMDSDIVATAALGTAQAIYSRNQMFLMQYTTDNSVVMSIKPAVEGLGAVSRRSIVSDGRFNWGLTRRGVFRTDGIGKSYVDEPRVRKFIRDEIDWENQEQIFGTLDETNHIVQWHVPVTSGFKTLAYDYVGDSWTFPQENIYASGEEGIFSGILLASSSSVSLVGTGTAAESWVQTKALDCGSREVNKTFQCLRMDMTADPGVVIKVGFLYESIYATVVFEQEFAVAEEINLEERTAIALVLRIEAPAGKTWRLGGFSIHGVPAGADK